MRAERDTERVCPKCGAAYSLSEPRCPYCGYIHETGAERKFFRRLEKTRQDLDMVDEEARAEYHREMRKNSGAAVKRILIAAAILAAIAGLFALTERYRFRDDRDYSREIVWQHEHFPELDRLYEEENYTELDALLNRYGAEGHDVWDWDRYDEYTERTEDEGSSDGEQESAA